MMRKRIAGLMGLCFILLLVWPGQLTASEAYPYMRSTIVDGMSDDEIAGAEQVLSYAGALTELLEEKAIPVIPDDRLLPRLVDQAGLFSDEEREALLRQLDIVSERQMCDVVIVTVDSLDGKEAMEVADDFYDYNGYGYGVDDDGILFLLSMEDRDQAYSTYGLGIKVFTDAEQEYLFDAIANDLSKNRYYEAFLKYIPLCEEAIAAMRESLAFGAYPEIPSERRLPRVVDEAGVLNNKDEALLISQLDEISENYECDVVVVVVDSIRRNHPLDFANDVFDYNGYGYGSDRDGILILFSIGNKDIAFSKRGFGITAFADAGLDYIFGQVGQGLKNGDYYKAFAAYADHCDEFLWAAREGRPMRAADLPMSQEERMDQAMNILVSAAVALVGGILISFGIIAAMAKKSAGGVEQKTSAHEYMIADSLNLTRSDDRFIRSAVTKTRRQTESSSSGGGGRSSGGGSSTHSSSSGRSHGGSGRKF